MALEEGGILQIKACNHDVSSEGMPIVLGTVKLISSQDDVVLIPTPTQDPRDPLNLPSWRKAMIILVTSIFGALALPVMSGLGALVGFVLPQIRAEGKTDADFVHLMTFPALAMGIGNFLFMPLALAIGRRPVFLGAIAVMLSMSALCSAYSRNYSWHLGARIILGLAAGQCEALTPMMVQESYFIHERARVLTWQWAIQSILVSILSITASYQTAAFGLRWWYGFYAIGSAVLLIAAFVLVPETKYHRPMLAFEGKSVAWGQEINEVDNRISPNLVQGSNKPERKLALVHFKPRTWLSDLKIIVGTPDWDEASLCYRHMTQLFCFPNVFWVVLMNGVLLGISVALSTTYGSILLAKPYNWAKVTVGFAQGAQAVVVFVAIPILGFYSDWNIKWMSRRNGGVHESESRLVPLILPITMGVIACVIYGQAGQYPEHYHWFAIVFGYCAQFFSLSGASIVGQAYLLDSYPSRQGAVLVLVCATRGIIQFGLNYGVAQFSAAYGYAVVFGTYGGLTAFLGAVGILVFYFGKNIRQYTNKWVIDSHGKDASHREEAYHTGNRMRNDVSKV